MKRGRPRQTPGSAVLAVALAPLALAGCGNRGEASNRKGSEEVPVNVRTMVVERTTLREYLTISGILRPVRGTEISTEERGVVAAIPAEKGAQVAEGDVILELDRDLLEAEMRSAEANRAYEEYKESRTRRLHEANQASRQEMLLAETRLEEARARADIARLRWERAAIKAPFAGILSDRFVEEGQLVAEGTPVVRIADPYTLKLAAAVSEREVPWIEVGAPAAITVNGLDETRPGIVSWVSFEADPTNGKFQVEVQIDNPGLELRPGVVGRAQVVKCVHPDAMVVPRDAVVLRPEGPTVYVVEGERAAARRVTLGPDQGLMTIVEEGLEQGERIVVRGQRELADGSPVLVREEATAPDGSTAADPAEVRAAEAFAPLTVERPRETPGTTPETGSSPESAS